MMWTVHLEGGPRRVNHAAVAVPEKRRIYSFGGYCTGEDYHNTRPMDVHVLNTVTNKWRAIPTPKPEDPDYKETPYQRYGHSAVEYEGCAYIWGGRNDSQGACDILWCFNTDTEKWSRVRDQGAKPGGRDGHSACVIRDTMYIFGGYEEEIDRFCNDIYCLDFNTFTWTKCLIQSDTAPLWRDFHTSTSVGDEIYVFGGRSDRGGPIYTNHEVYSNRVHVFNTLSCRWSCPTTTGEEPVGRRSHSCFVHNGLVFIFGGYNGELNQHFGDLCCFDPESCVWRSVKTMGVPPCPRRRQCCCVLGDKVYIFGGTSPQANKLTENDSDLTDLHDLHVLEFAPSLKTLCLLTVIKRKLPTDGLPQIIRWEISNMTTNSTITRTQSNNG